MNTFKSKLAMVFLVLASSLQAQINHPNKTRLNEGWEFLRGDLGNVWEAVRPAAIGSPETVPLWDKVTQIGRASCRERV